MPKKNPEQRVKKNENKNGIQKSSESWFHDLSNHENVGTLQEGRYGNAFTQCGERGELANDCDLGDDHRGLAAFR
jgi:hypothetical protein